MDGWATFAKKVIAALDVYDKQHKTSYSYYLTRKGAKPDEDGVKALAEVMRKVDRASQWEPILKGPRTND